MWAVCQSWQHAQILLEGLAVHHLCSERPLLGIEASPIETKNNECLKETNFSSAHAYRNVGSMKISVPREVYFKIMPKLPFHSLILE